MKKNTFKNIIATLILILFCNIILAQSAIINTSTNNGIQVPSNFIGFSFDPAYYSQYFSTSYNSNNSRTITKQLFNNFYPFQKPDVRFLGNNGMYWKNGTYSIPTTWNYASTTPYNYVCASCPSTAVASALSMTSGDDINTTDLDNYKGFLDQLNYKPTTLFGISLAFLDPERAKDFSLTVKNKFIGYDYLFEIGNEPDAYISNARRTSTYNASEFTNEFKLIKDALITANPQANIAGPAYAKTNNTSGTSWSGGIGNFIDNVGTSLKVVTMHDYPLGLDAVGNNFNNYLAKFLSNNYSNDEVANLSTGLAPSINTSKLKNVAFRLAEANSIAGGGSIGISDAFGSALWVMDFMFELAKAGASGIDIMTAGGSTTYYSPFSYSSTFVASGQKVRVNPIYYGMLFFANATQNNAKILDISNQTGITESTNNFKIWATKDANNTTRILVINRGTSITDVSSKTITLTVPGSKMAAKKYDLLATGGSVTAAIGKTVVSGANFTIGGQTISPIDGSLTGTTTNTTITSVNETYTITLPAASASILEIPQNDCSVLNPATPSLPISNFTYCQNATNVGTISATVSSGNILQWYTTATGGTATSTVPTISTVNSGTYNFYVSQKESTLGCESNRAVITININPLPTLSSITGTISATVSNTSTLSNSTPGGAWTSSDNTVATINPNGVVSALKAGTTTITYAYTNSNNCSNSVSILFTVFPNVTITAPIISATGPINICDGQNVVLSSNDPTNIQWYKNGTAITNAINQTYTANSSGTYKVVKTSGSNSVSSNEIIINVNPLPTLSIITGTLTTTVGSNATLANSTPGGTWTSSDNTVATINSNGVVSALKAGTTTITYTYTNSNGCSNSVSNTFTVAAITTIVPPIISATGPTTICDGQNVVLSSNDATNIQWYKNGTAITNAINQTYTATSSGTYKVVKTSGSNSINSNEVVVTVNSIPAAPVISRDNNNNLISSFSGTHLWYKESTIIPNETNNIYKPTTNGIYASKATNMGCESNLSNNYYFVVTDVININNDDYISLGPNPFNSYLNLNYHIKPALFLNMKVYHIPSGMLVLQKERLNTNEIINLSNLSSGTYLIELFNSATQICYKFKLIKL